MKMEFSRQFIRKKLKYQISSKSIQWESSCPTRSEERENTTTLTVDSDSFANLCIAITTELFWPHILGYPSLNTTRILS